MEDKKYSATVKKLPASKVEITASVPAEEFDKTRAKAIAHIGEEFEMPGFRKGKVPESMLVAKIGEGAILTEMAEMAIAHAYPAIVVAEKLDVIGRPNLRITKMAPGNPLEFVIETAVVPAVGLPDYKALAKKENGKKEAVQLTDEEVEKTIAELLRSRAPKLESTPAIDGVPSLPVPEVLPELDDAFVRTLGDFKDVADFRTKLRENMQAEKERMAHDKLRMSIMDALVAKSDIELPEIIVEQEMRRIEDEFKHDIERMGIPMDKYLEVTKTTLDEMRKRWRPDAEKRAKAELVIAEIAIKEKLTPEESELERETAELAKRYPDAEAERVRGFVHMLHVNRKVLEFLEAQ
jgi:FKBP-type peptidyl-prolyl cis-trans isomerase (trigger factor)